MYHIWSILSFQKLDNSFAVLEGLEDDPDWPDAAPTPGASVPANIAVPLGKKGWEEELGVG